MCFSYFSSWTFSPVRDGVYAAVSGEGEKSPEEADCVCGHSASVQPHRAPGEYR